MIRVFFFEILFHFVSVLLFVSLMILKKLFLQFSFFWSLLSFSTPFLLDTLLSHFESESNPWLELRYVFKVYIEVIFQIQIIEVGDGLDSLIGFDDFLDHVVTESKLELFGALSFGFKICEKISDKTHSKNSNLHGYHKPNSFKRVIEDIFRLFTGSK